MDKILEQVQSGDFDPVAMFTGNKEKFLEVKTAIEKISNNLTKETCVEFLVSKIMPTVFDKSVNNEIRDEAVEIGFHLLKYVSLSNLGPREQEVIFASVEDTYTKTVGELRDGNYANWDRLWIFLIRLCHEKLHHKMSTANKLLRVVEVAFRNSTSVEPRLKAYDCWVELIDNSSLNMAYMCSPRQIKLLLTPMKAKFSRMPVVIMKRCDTFVYLLEKLQDKAVLCLREFLEFCFGPFEDKNDGERLRQGKSVPEVCIKSTKVLIEIIGHSHINLETCIQTDDINLNKQVITDANFTQFAEILIKSVVECCVLLNEWNKDATNMNTIIKCLWLSIFNLINKSNDETRIRCRNIINYSLRKLLERLDEKHFNVIISNIIEVIIKTNTAENFNETVFDISMNLLQQIPLDSSPSDKIIGFITACFERENGLKFSKSASHYFKTDKCENLEKMCEIWLKSSFLVTPGNVTALIWPIRNLQNFKDFQVLSLRWSTLYKNECKSEVVKASIIQEMVKLFQENPLMSSNIVAFLQLISDAETNPSSSFVSRFMRLVETVLTLPTLSDENVKTLSAIVLLCCEQKRNIYKLDNNDEAVEKLCACLEHLIIVHKNFSVLSSLASHLKEAQQRNLSKFSKRLMPFLETLMLNEENSTVSATRKLIELLETKENEAPSSLASSRSMRMVNMANVTPKSGGSLRLFGSSKPKNSRKQIFDDEKSSDFVRIDTEVKLDPNNLNEHQKEVLKKRRDDIPALYQDLSQDTQNSDIVPNSEPSAKRKLPEDCEPKLETSTQKIEECETGEASEPKNGIESMETSLVLIEESTPKKKPKKAPKKLEESALRKSARQLNRREKTKKPEAKAEKQIESFEDLLARVDKRIEEKKVKAAPPPAQHLPDGNQNKIASLDVYEFTGEETKKTVTKKKKSAEKRRVTMNERDYITKRSRKKTKKSKDGGAGYPFHVTADTTPEPLGESNTPRTVKESEKETITIAITRSPPGDKKPETVNNSEDVIESSQKNPNKKRLRVPKRRMSLETNVVTIARRSQRSKSLDQPISLEPITLLDLKEKTLPDTLTLGETKDDLPASPITCDTPDRNAELLSNTLDISPITSAEGITSTPTPRSSTNEVASVRVARLLQMVNPNARLLGGRQSSPSGSRVRKMRLRKEEKLDVLTFTREVPSPLTVPASGILKRKFASLDETATATPSPKRKRVNFSDPATTEKKIFIKDIEEYSPEIVSTQDLAESDSFAEKRTDRRVKLGKMFLDAMDKEEIIDAIKEFCNSQLENDNTSFKNALKCLIQNLKIPEMTEIISDTLLNFDPATVEDIAQNLVDNDNSLLVVNKVVLPFLDNPKIFDLFLPKLLNVLEKLPREKLDFFTDEFVKIFGESKIDSLVKEKMAKQQVEEHVVKLDCDSMKNLVQKYFLNLEDQKRNGFIVDLMNMASEELPVNKEFINSHVNLLHNFVKRMTD